MIKLLLFIATVLGVWVLSTALGAAPAAGAPDWSPAPTALQKASVPLIAMLVIALTVLFSFAWYRVALGRSLTEKDDD